MALPDDKARKLAEEVLNTGGIDDLSNYEGVVLAHKLIELLDRQRWIPVSERLPKNSCTIPILVNSIRQYTADYYIGHGFKRIYGAWGVEIDISWLPNITHWFALNEVPLPQPPEQKPLVL